MNFELSGIILLNLYYLEDELNAYLLSIKGNYNKEDIDFDLFARVVAVILEEASYNNKDGG